MQTQILSSKPEIVNLNYIHEILLPEELDIDRGFNSFGIDQFEEK